MDVVVTVLYAFVGLLLLTFTAMGFLDSTRGTPVSAIRAPGDHRGPPAVSDPLFRETIQLLTGTRLTPGNRIEALANGDGTFPRLWADLAAAERSIALQMYYCKGGTVADVLKAVLVERARAGVCVFFLYDAYGSSLPRKYWRELREAGVAVAAFRPIRFHTVHTARHRSHVRVVAIDGRVGYTGGFGVDDKWLGDGRSEGHWRDTNVRFTGPAVLQLLAMFGSCWAEATGDLLTGSLCYPLDEESGAPAAEVAGVLHAAPTVGSTSAERFFALSIAGARKKLYITNSYFVPDDDFRRFMREAAGRGVDVRILVPGEKTDIRTTRYAGRARYDELLSAGVRIYEYQPVMIHAKTMVVDGIWSTIGSMNTDNRSMAFNNESNLIALDSALASELESMFLDDLRYSREIVLEEFRRRSMAVRVLERGAHFFSRVL